MSDKYVIRTKQGDIVCSILTGQPMLLDKALAIETRADLDCWSRYNSPHRVEPAPAELLTPSLGAM